MSIIYSAGQYDDAFCPRRLGNWEAGAKEACPNLKLRQVCSSKTKIIVDSRGHLLPSIPRDKTTAWGLLNYYLQSKYEKSIQQTMAMMSGPGRQCPHSEVIKKFKKLPKYTAQKTKENSPNEDILLEYLHDLSLPIVWIIGPPTKNTFHKRKQFAKQLATKLGFGYVNLDEKIQAWKDRQATCTCPHPHIGKSTCSTAASAHSLASTSIAPNKLPTNVSPRISSELPVPPDTAMNQTNGYSLTMLDSQRIAFDTALPIERNKILELYKFAMAECLPCAGFILDSVPFDLVEGLAFEKIFYPAALAIYFTEGVQQKKNVRPKDQRVTASAVSTASSQRSKYLMNPNDEKAKKAGENLYLKMKSHKRLGTFSLTEGEKICKHFGSKTIRIINAEDVENDTMEFLNELIRRNLEKYEGLVTLGTGESLTDQDESVYATQPRHAPPSTMYSTFIPEGRELDDDIFDSEEMEALDEIHRMMNPAGGNVPDIKKDLLVETGPVVSNMPPALITAIQSETSLMTNPNLPSDHVMSSTAVSTAIQEELEDDKCSYDTRVADKRVETQEGSRELWEKIIKLETKVAELNPEEETKSKAVKVTPTLEKSVKDEFRLPPPTAYAQQEEDNRLTTAIRNAMVPNFVSQDSLLPRLRPTPTAPPQYDFGAGGDSVEVKPIQAASPSSSPVKLFMYKPHSQQSSSAESDPRTTASRKQNRDSSQDEDSFYDT